MPSAHGLCTWPLRMPPAHCPCADSVRGPNAQAVHACLMRMTGAHGPGHIPFMAAAPYTSARDARVAELVDAADSD